MVYAALTKKKVSQVNDDVQFSIVLWLYFGLYCPLCFGRFLQGIIDDYKSSV